MGRRAFQNGYWRFMLVLAIALRAASGTASAANEEGPKWRIAVAEFDGGRFASYAAGWDVGKALAAQLSTELMKTGRFVVLERQQLEAMLQEQTLGLEQLTTAETAAQPGRLIGAQLLVTGTLTDFNVGTGGGAIRVGAGGLGSLLRGVGVGVDRTTARVAIELRLIDASTGQVRQSHPVAAKVKGGGFSLQLDTRRAVLGSEHFYQTPLGVALQRTLKKAVAIIVREMERIPWTGRVVDVIDGLVYINAGTGSRIRKGDTLWVSVKVKELIDPETNRSLGFIEHQRGRIQVEAVQENYSVARPVGDCQPQRGDFLRIR